MAADEKVQNVLEISGAIMDAFGWSIAGGNPTALLALAIGKGASFVVSDPKVQTLYAQALADAHKELYPQERYPNFPVLNANRFRGYLNDFDDDFAASSYVTDLPQLNKALMVRLIDRGDLPDETTVDTRRFRDLAVDKFRASLKDHPDVTQKLLLQSFEGLKAHINTLPNRADYEQVIAALEHQSDDIAILQARIDPRALRELVGEEAGAWLENHLIDIIAAQAMAGSVDVKTTLRRLIAPPLLTFTTSKLTANTKPSTLLKSTYEVVPFAGREDELDDLTAWCEADAGFAVRLYVGAGGIGKTRLMRELCKRRQVDG